MTELYAALWLTCKLATLSSGLLLIFGFPLALWLVHGPRWLTTPLKALVNLPLILPPTVLGYYLLISMGRDGWLTEWFGLQLAFSFGGLLLGSLLYSLPFALGPYISALESLDHRYTDGARALGLNRWQTLRYVIFPLSLSGVVTGTGMAFAHTIGEFGVVLLIGGNIPHQTQTAAIYLFDLIQALEYQKAGKLAFGLLCTSLLFLLLLQWWETYIRQKWQK